MKIYRGPGSKTYPDKSHAFVANISSDALERSIRDGRFISFNISEDRKEQNPVCTLVLEDEDIIPMVSALLSLIPDIQARKKALSDMAEIMDDMLTNPKDKIGKLYKLIGDI